MLVFVLQVYELHDPTWGRASERATTASASPSPLPGSLALSHTVLLKMRG